MNKKFISLVTTFTLCVSNFTFVCAKETNLSKTYPNSIDMNIDMNIDTETDSNIEDYLSFKGDLLQLKDNVPKNEEQFMREFVEAINDLIKTNKIKVDKDTFTISKINKSRTKRDVEPGEWHQVGYLSHSQIQKIDTWASTIGIGTSLKDLADVAKQIKKLGISGISQGVWITLFLNVGVTATIYNLKCACEDNNHNGAYILQYGNNNMYMPYKNSRI